MLLEKAENFFILGKKLLSLVLVLHGLFWPLSQSDERPWGKIFDDGKSWF